MGYLEKERLEDNYNTIGWIQHFLVVLFKDPKKMTLENKPSNSERPVKY